MGQVDGLPVGLSFVGPAWSEGRLLALAYDFERSAPGRLVPGFPPSARVAGLAGAAGEGR